MMRGKFARRLIGWIIPAGLLLVWFFSSAVGLIPEYLLPSPQRLFLVILDFITGIGDLTPYSRTFAGHMLVSLRRVLTGFGIAALLGMMFGFLTGRNPFLSRMLDPFINGVRAVPGIGWMPVAIVWFGIGEGNTLFLIGLAAFFPVYINTAHGSGSIHPQLIQAGQMLGANRRTLFLQVIVPASFPEVLVGLRLSLGIAWAYLVLGEMTGVSKGIGAVMADSRMLGRVDMILACMVLIALMGKLSDLLLVTVCGRIFPQKAVKNVEN